MALHQQLYNMSLNSGVPDWGQQQQLMAAAQQQALTQQQVSLHLPVGACCRPLIPIIHHCVIEGPARACVLPFMLSMAQPCKQAGHSGTADGGQQTAGSSKAVLDLLARLSLSCSCAACKRICADQQAMGGIANGGGYGSYDMLGQEWFSKGPAHTSGLYEATAPSQETLSWSSTLLAANKIADRAKNCNSNHCGPPPKAGKHGSSHPNACRLHLEALCSAPGCSSRWCLAGRGIADTSAF